MKKDNKIKYTIKNLKLAYGLAWKISKKLFFMSILKDVVIGNVLSFSLVYLLKRVVDYITVTVRSSELGFDAELFGLCLGVFLLKLLSSVSSNYFNVFRQKMESKANEQMQNLLIRKISRIKMEYFEQSDFYNRFNMARSTAVKGVLGVFNDTNDVVSSLITLIIAASILLGNHIWLVIPVIVFEASFVILWQKVSVLDYKATQINVPEERKLGFLSSLFAKKAAAQDIKLNEAASFLNDKQRSLYRKIAEVKKNISKKTTVLFAIVEFLGLVSDYGLYFFCAYKAVTGGISAADFTYFVGISKNLISSTGFVVSMIGSLYYTAMDMDNFRFILECEEERKCTAGKLKNGFDGLKVKNLSFCYPGSQKEVLKNISFSVSPKEKVCIVGQNGAGKTTLSKLLIGLYNDFDGAIEYNGIDSESLDKQDVYGLFSVAMQDYCKYPLTVRDNIIISDWSDRDNRSVEEVSGQASADGFIAGLKDGYDTMLNKALSDDGTELSEGQWHKLVLARALYRDRDVLLFDEPSNSLDPIAEKNFMDALMEKYKDKTIIIISHRLSCCTAADKIIVMDDGKVVDIGTHKELMKRNGIYKTMFETQAAAYIES